MAKQYLTNCTCGDGDAIGEMVDRSRDITRRTFLRHVDRKQFREFEQSLGYCRHPRQGLTMAGDYHVSYSKSVYRGQPCVFVTWSCIEYVFVEPNDQAS